MTALASGGLAGNGMERRRFLLAGGALVVAAGLGEVLTPRRIVAPPLDRKLDALTPRAFAGWRSNAADDAPPETLAENVYDQIVCRVYARAGAPPVAAAQRGLTRMHLPHGCYQSAGYTVADLLPTSAPMDDGRTTPAVRFSARRGDDVQQVLYWSRIGSRFAQSFSGQNWAVTQAALQGVIPDGVLFRLSCALGEGSAALATLEVFARELVQAAPPQLRRVLLG